MTRGVSGGERGLVLHLQICVSRAWPPDLIEDRENKGLNEEGKNKIQRERIINPKGTLDILYRGLTPLPSKMDGMAWKIKK